MDALESRAEYDVRVNRAVDFIEKNLARDPGIGEIARVAGFSTYHFHRLFSAQVNESLGQFKSRLRIERAAVRLLDRTDEPITEVALDLGYSSSATFARSFRAHFGMGASEWRKHSDLAVLRRSPCRDGQSFACFDG